jgi:hypothetical protein
MDTCWGFNNPQNILKGVFWCLYVGNMIQLEWKEQKEGLRGICYRRNYKWCPHAFYCWCNGLAKCLVFWKYLRKWNGTVCSAAIFHTMPLHVFCKLISVVEMNCCCLLFSVPQITYESNTLDSECLVIFVKVLFAVHSQQNCMHVHGSSVMVSCHAMLVTHNSCSVLPSYVSGHCNAMYVKIFQSIRMWTIG